MVWPTESVAEQETRPSAAAGRSWVSTGRLIVLAVLVALVIGGATLWSDRPEWLGGAIDAGTPRPAAPELTADERAFYAFVSPRIRTIHAEAAELARMGHEKSRNLIEIRARGDRIDAGAEEIADYLAATAVPPRFAAPMDEYGTAVAAVKGAMEASWQGFVRLDWERVARAVTLMDSGVARLAWVIDDLEGLAGELEGTPTVESRPAAYGQAGAGIGEEKRGGSEGR